MEMVAPGIKPVGRALRAAASGLALMSGVAAGPAAQAQAPVYKPVASAADRVEPGYAPPRLAFGQPDLQGVWSNASNTGLTRGPRYASLIMSDAEAATAREANPSNIRQKTDDNQKTSDGLLDGKDLAAGRGYNAFWIDPGNNYANVRGTWRTSWIVDPPSGQIPLTDAGRKAMAGFRGRGTGFDHPEERSLGERCIIGFGGTGGPPMMNVLYNNNYRIVQSPNHVMIEVEMNHDARIIPLVRSAAEADAAHKPGDIRPYLGDSVGWWDGDTLVVQTKNMHPAGGGRAPITEKGRIVERFTRWNDRQVLYEFEVSDPSLYLQPWKGEVGLNRGVDLYEYACHEGNYGLEGILAGGRAAERAGKPREADDKRDEG
jgi:hypothetical protein